MSRLCDNISTVIQQRALIKRENEQTIKNLTVISDQWYLKDHF